MKTVKQAAEYTVMQRRDGRYAIRAKDKKWINGDDKVKILVKEGLIKADKPKAKPEPEKAPVEEVADGEASGEGAEEDTAEDSGS